MIIDKAKDELELVTENEATKKEMLGTIALPRNLDILSSRLPKPNYELVGDKSTPIEKVKHNEVPMNKKLQVESIRNVEPIKKVVPPLIKSIGKKVEPIQSRPIIQRIHPEKIKPYRYHNQQSEAMNLRCKYRNEVQEVINSQQIQGTEKGILDTRPSYLVERNKRENLKDHINFLYSNERKIASSQEPRRYQDLPPVQHKPSTKQQNRHPPPRIYHQKIPFLKKPQVERPINRQRKIASVDVIRKQEQNKRVAEYYKANPMRIKLNPIHYERQPNNIGKPKVNNGLIYHKNYKGYSDNSVYKSKPQYNIKQSINTEELEYKKPKQFYNGKEVESGNGVVIQKYKPIQVKKVEKMVLQRPHYNVLPEWWG
jgi:hypothetical protein